MVIYYNYFSNFVLQIVLLHFDTLASYSLAPTGAYAASQDAGLNS